MKGGLISFMELQRVPENTVTSLEGPDITAAKRKSSVYPKSNRDETRIPCICSRAIPHSPSNMTSGFTSVRQLPKYPENNVPSLEEHQVQHCNSREALCTPNHLAMRPDSLASTQVQSQLSTSTSRRGFAKLYLCERDPEFAASRGIDTDMLWLKRRSGFPPVTWMQARLSSQKVKRCLNPLWKP